MSRWAATSKTATTTRSWPVTPSSGPGLPVLEPTRYWPTCSIYEKTQALIRRIIILPGRAEVGLAEHRAVLEAMRDGNASLAEERRRHNMASAKEFLRRYERFVL